MMRSLFSGVSGLRTHQTKMDVIGNNIANVNTVAYKSQSVTFQDLMYQTTQAASGANEQTGRAGINAKQIGLGVKSGAISTAIATQGASQNTGNPFDIQINGDAFFVVSDGQTNFFTRAGAFNVDANGTLCMSTNGYTVMGWLADDDGNIIKNTVSALDIMSERNMISPAEATTEGYLSGIIDSNDSNVKSENGLVSTLQFYDSKGYSYTLKTATHQSLDADGKAITGQFWMEATDILDADGKSLLTYENTGYPTAASDKTKALSDVEKKAYLSQLNLFSVGTSDDDASVKDGTGLATINVSYNEVNGTWTRVGGGSTATVATTTDPTTGKVTTNITYAAAAITLPDDGVNTGFTLNLSAFKSPVAISGGTAPATGLIEGFDTGAAMDVDMTTSKNIDNNGASTLAGKTGTIESGTKGCGHSAGEMDAISIDVSGKIIASYTNGMTKVLGQIAVAEFANPAGLEKAGENLYKATANSGNFDGVGVDITASGGSMSSGVLEMSNVDLSQEFTEMITTQRGFQANSRIITVSDTMLEELVNLKR